MTIVWQIVDSSSIGGIEKHMAVLTDSLRHHRFDARIVLLEDHGASPWIDQLKNAGLTPRHLDGSIRGLYQAMRSDRPALVHTHGYKAGILGRLTATALRIPSVSTFHMGETPRWPVNLYALVDNLTSLLSTRIAVSAEIQSRLPYSSRLIPNYIQVPRTQPTFPSAPNTIGFVGRLSHEKAPDYFCELARRFTSKPFTWHVYGDGPLRTELEREFADHVTFHGMVTDMTAVWATLGLTVMPSRAEGLPLASIEALAAGVPVVASNVGDLAKVVTDNTTGWLAPEGNLDLFEQVIEQWMELDQLSKDKLRKSSWAHAHNNFSENSALPAILEIYDRLGVKPAETVAPSSCAAAAQNL